MVPILVNIIHHECFFLFQTHFFAVYSFLTSNFTSWPSLMYHHWFSNKCNRVKRQHWRWLVYAPCNFLLHVILLHVFRSNHFSFCKFHKKETALMFLSKKDADLQREYFMGRPSCLFFSILDTRCFK